MKDERASQGQGVADQFEVVGIDAALLLEEKSRGRVHRVVENLGKDRRYLILTLEGNSIEEEAAKAFVREPGLRANEIRNLADILANRSVANWKFMEKVVELILSLEGDRQPEEETSRGS